MKRFQTMMNTLTLMVILTIALCSVAQILFPNQQQANSASNPGSTISTLPPMPDFEAQQSKTYQLVAGSVHDGDTLRVTDGGEEIKIRLCGIDAPEIDRTWQVTNRGK
jgi:endonuclease YncB( thermonuclease family)